MAKERIIFGLALRGAIGAIFIISFITIYCVITKQYITTKQFMLGGAIFYLILIISNCVSEIIFKCLLHKK